MNVGKSIAILCTYNLLLNFLTTSGQTFPCLANVLIFNWTDSTESIIIGYDELQKEPCNAAMTFIAKENFRVTARITYMSSDGDDRIALIDGEINKGRLILNCSHATCLTKRASSGRTLTVHFESLNGQNGQPWEATLTHEKNPCPPQVPIFFVEASESLEIRSARYPDSVPTDCALTTDIRVRGCEKCEVKVDLTLNSDDLALSIFNGDRQLVIKCSVGACEAKAPGTLVIEAISGTGNGSFFGVARVTTGPPPTTGHTMALLTCPPPTSDAILPQWVTWLAIGLCGGLALSNVSALLLCCWCLKRKTAHSYSANGGEESNSSAETRYEELPMDTLPNSPPLASLPNMGRSNMRDAAVGTASDSEARAGPSRRPRRQPPPHYSQQITLPQPPTDSDSHY